MTHSNYYVPIEDVISRAPRGSDIVTINHDTDHTLNATELQEHFLGECRYMTLINNEIRMKFDGHDEFIHKRIHYVDNQIFQSNYKGALAEIVFDKHHT